MSTQTMIDAFERQLQEKWTWIKQPEACIHPRVIHDESARVWFCLRCNEICPPSPQITDNPPSKTLEVG